MSLPTTLAADVSANQTTIDCADFADQDGDFVVLIGSERLYVVRDATAATWYAGLKEPIKRWQVQRGYQGTTKAAHSSGAAVTAASQTAGGLSSPLTADLDADGHTITNLADPVDDGDAVPKSGLAGMTLVRGPFVLTAADFPDVLDEVALMTPAAGDVLLDWFVDPLTYIAFDGGDEYLFGQDISNGVSPAPPTENWYGKFTVDSPTYAPDNTTVQTFAGSENFSPLHRFPFPNNHPIVALRADNSGDDPTVGHVELYLVIATPVAP